MTNILKENLNRIVNEFEEDEEDGFETNIGTGQGKKLEEAAVEALVAKFQSWFKKKFETRITEMGVEEQIVDGQPVEMSAFYLYLSNELSADQNNVIIGQVAEFIHKRVGGDINESEKKNKILLTERNFMITGCSMMNLNFDTEITFDDFDICIRVAPITAV